MANKDSSAKKIDLSAVKKINFAKLKRLKAVNIIAKVAIYFYLSVLIRILTANI